VIVVTVDGRRATSHGGTLTEMAELMVELGADRAINLDGGGSTTMYVAEGGVVNRPSRGWEREVINHIGFIAPAPAAAPAAHAAGDAPRRWCSARSAIAARHPRRRAGPGTRACAAGSGALRALRGSTGCTSGGTARWWSRRCSWRGGAAVLSVVFWVVSRARRARARSQPAWRSPDERPRRARNRTMNADLN
jgi:hypothetical protein